MVSAFFATDLHGRTQWYEKLLASIARERPAAVFLGGDLLPCHGFSRAQYPDPAACNDFVPSYLIPSFTKMRDSLGGDYPAIFLILGNDDSQSEQERFLVGQALGLWQHIHKRRILFGNMPIYGFACVPPTPFLLKDWERYDVSRHVPPGCVSPEEGFRSVPVEANEIKWGTIQKDLALLTEGDSLEHAIFLFHTPPYDTPLDRANLDGKTHEHVPLDVHVGSIAVRRFIEARQPLLTLHGHVHESARLTGEWKIRIGRTVCISAAYEGPELALVRFDLESPGEATRELL